MLAKYICIRKKVKKVSVLIPLILTSCFTILAIDVLPVWASISIAQSNVSRVNQCNKLVETINQINSSVKYKTAIFKNSLTPAESLLLLGEINIIVKQSIDNMSVSDFTDTQLKGFQQRFISIYQLFIQAFQNLADAIREGNPQQRQFAFNQLENYDDSLDLLENEVNKVCSNVGANLIQHSKIDQCQQLIRVANHAVSEIESMSTIDTPDHLDEMRQIKIVADHAASGVNALFFSDPQLKEFQQRFFQMYSGVSRSISALIAADSRQDSIAANLAFRDLKSFTALEDPLVQEINTYCPTEVSSQSNSSN